MDDIECLLPKETAQLGRIPPAHHALHHAIEERHDFNVRAPQMPGERACSRARDRRRVPASLQAEGQVDYVPLGPADIQRIGDETDVHKTRVDKLSKPE